MNGTILTVIGGGSVNWMRNLMRDFYMVPEVEGGEIRLVDPNAEHVNAVADMLKEFNRQRGKDFKISVMEDRVEALSDADFVLLTFSPGAMPAFYNDLEIPVKYGVRLPVSMTCGPCGISAALRTAPVAAEIVEEMEKVCPGAWVLNETNPMTVVTSAMNRVARKTHVLGLCHEVHSLRKILNPVLGLEPPEDMNVTTYLYEWLAEQGVEYQFGGLNHFIFLTRLKMHGKDMLPKVREWACESREIASTSADGKDSGLATTSFHDSGSIKKIICDQTGYIPIAGDRHTVEFWPGLCNPANGYGMRWVKKTFVDERRLWKISQLQSIRDIVSGKEKIEWKQSGEEFSMIVSGILSGKPVRSVVNVPNKGQIENLPGGLTVETPGIIYPDHIEPENIGRIPGVPGAWNGIQAQVALMTLDAALEGSRDKFIQALCMDPACGIADFSLLPRMADELLKANKEWLPRFYD